LAIVSRFVAEPSNYELDVWGDIPGVNFTFTAGSELIYGYVKDANGTGIPDVPIYAENGPMALETTSGTDGYYEFHVSSGWWYVNIDQDFLAGHYMYSQGQYLEVTVEEITRSTFLFMLWMLT
jgi:hypothetical protein